MFDDIKQSRFLEVSEGISKLLNHKNDELNHLFLVFEVPEQAFPDLRELRLLYFTLREEELKELNDERIMSIVYGNHKLGEIRSESLVKEKACFER